MRQALVVQHVPNEGLGSILPILRLRGIEPFYVRPYAGHPFPESVGQFSVVIVLGGPMGVYEADHYPYLNDEIALVRECISLNRPVLGICLGAQIMASAAGARVYPGPAKEIGWYDLALTVDGRRDQLMSGLPDTMRVFQWHGDTFDIPPGAVNLASSKQFQNQLLRVGERAYGLQFHLEVTTEMIGDFIRVGGSELDAVRSYIDPTRITAETQLHIDRLGEYGEALFNAFLNLAD